MNEYQQQVWDEVYQFIHDEKNNCNNLAGIVELAFPDTPDDLSRAIKKVIAPYLRVRGELGDNIMNLIYELKKQMEE